MATRLDQILSLATSTRYARPEQAGQLLPVAIGDWRTGGEGGLLPTVLVDTTNFIYVASGGGAVSIDSVWDVSGAEITTGVTKYLATNLEGQGVVAALQFTAAQVGPIYWRGQGLPTSAGACHANPITAWEAILREWGAWSALDFEPTALESARRACDAQGYTFAALLDREQSVGAWLTTWARDLLADYYLDRQRRLVLEVETGAAVPEAQLAAHIIAARDVVRGEAGVTMQADLSSLVNILKFSHLWHPRRGDYSSAGVERTSAPSRGVYGDQARALACQTVRSTAHLDALATVLFALLDGTTRPAPALVRFACHDPGFGRLTRNDRIGFSWDAGPASGADKYRNRILKVLNVDLQPPAGPVTIEALETGKRLLSAGAPDLILRLGA
jgi:hypothetical protein